MAPELERLVYSVPQAAAVLEVSPRTVRRDIAAGRLPTVRIRGRVLIPRKALAEWVAAHTEAAS